MTFTETAIPSRSSSTGPPVERALPQLSRRGVLAVWAAAALPMAAMAWVVAPILAHQIDGPAGFAQSLIVCLTIALVWQGVLVAGLVWREQHSLRWSVVRDALWLRSPRSPKSGRTGGKVWWVVLLLLVGTAAAQELPTFPVPGGRDLAEFLASDTAANMFHGSWGWFAVVVTMAMFNTVLGEELVFRGYLLPRMRGAFGDRDWIVNGLLFTGYHLHIPWAMPSILFDTFLLAYPAKRYRSALVSIAVHSVQSVIVIIIGLSLVL
jgi:membrane protease YdiL (CAAX protease family)